MAAGRGPKLQVKNTFLDYAEDPLQDDDLAEIRRPRAHTDITDLKAPRKVSYNIDSSSGKASLDTTFEDNAVPPRSRMNTGVMTPMRSPDMGYMPMNLADLTADLAGAPMLPGGALGGGFPGMVPPAAGYPPMPAGFPGYGMPGLAGLPGLPGLPGAPPWAYGAGYPGMPHGHPPHMLPGVLGHRPPEHGAYEPSAASAGPAWGAQGARGPQNGQRQPADRARGKGGRGRGGATAADGGSPGWPQGQAGKKAEATPPAAPGRTGRGGSASGRGRGGAAAAADPGPANDSEVIRELPLHERKTVMLRNIPNRYTQMMLLQLLDEKNFEGTYDFVYLPMDFRNGVNLGYVFVNMLEHEGAVRLTEVFHGYNGWCFESAKVCEVSWAHPHQGLDQHVERYRNSPVMHPTMPEDFKPMMFDGGKRVDFPPPTKAIRAPKLRVGADKEKAGAAAEPAAA